jgi:excisionase family DNA binding protein
MSLSAKEAAQAVGISKSAILKAIRTGKISAIKDWNGDWRIEAVELFRRYPPVGAIPHQSVQQSAPNDGGILQREIAQLRKTVDSLETRLDNEKEERHMLLRMLTDSQHTATAAPQAKPSGWLVRFIHNLLPG